MLGTDVMLRKGIDSILLGPRHTTKRGKNGPRRADRIL